MRLACVSCIDGVTDENVMAFLDEVGSPFPLVLKCLMIARESRPPRALLKPA